MFFSINAEENLVVIHEFVGLVTEVFKADLLKSCAIDVVDCIWVSQEKW